MNLYDILLARCICSNKEDESVTVTPLEVTENGEYEAEEGYAYNPVTVNVSGGGGGDLTTAEVTLVNNSSVNIQFYGAFCYDEGGEQYSSCEPLYATAGNTTTAVAILYKGVAVIYSDNEGVSFSVSGNAEFTDNTVFATGDCSITAVNS